MELEKEMEERNKLKEQANITGDKESYNKYKEMRNDIGTKLKKAKENYFKEKFSNNNIPSSEI